MARISAQTPSSNRTLPKYLGRTVARHRWMRTGSPVPLGKAQVVPLLGGSAVSRCTSQRASLLQLRLVNSYSSPPSNTIGNMAMTSELLVSLLVRLQLEAPPRCYLQHKEMPPAQAMLTHRLSLLRSSQPSSSSRVITKSCCKKNYAIRLCRTHLTLSEANSKRALSLGRSAVEKPK